MGARARTAPMRALSAAEVPGLVSELFDPARAVPIVAVTTRGRYPLVDPDRVAAELGDLARVVLMQTGEAIDALVDALPDKLGVFGGAARIWWGGLTSEDDPYDHPLVWVRPAEPGLAETRILRTVRERVVAPSPSTPIGAGPAAGETVDAVVVATDRGGARFDVDGRPARAHVSRLARGRVEEPRDVLRVGQHVRAVVGEIGDDGLPRLDLSALEGDAWERLAEQARPGEIVRGRVVKAEESYALLELLPGVTGIVPGQFLRPGERLEVGDVVAARLTALDARARRASLSLRDAPVSVEGAKPVRLLDGGPVFLAADDAEAEAGASELDRLRAEVARLEGALADSRVEIEALNEERARLAAEARRLREAARASARPARARAASDAEWLARLRDAYDRLYASPSDREAYPMVEVHLAPGFLASANALAGVDEGRILDVAAHVAAGRAQDIPGLRVHALRESEAGGAPQRRRADGARAWRVALQVGSHAARRLHYWTLTEGGRRVVELVHAGTHDDAAPMGS